MSEEKKITVCDNCLCASCWHSEFYCEDYKTAGTTERTIAELKELNVEHESHYLVMKRHLC